jgi:WD40 repeat protein/DNA-binding XRE family transcriptional regulator
MKSSYQYRERDYTFGNLCMTLRNAIGVTQAELAKLLGVTERAIQTWEGGESYPKVDSLKRFIALCVQHQAFPVGQEEEGIRALWKAARQRVLLDETWLRALLRTRPTPAITSTTEVHTVPGPASAVEPAAFPRIDWVGALDVSHFAGREVELAALTQWILQERCRLIAILGMGGIGKSSLVSLLGKQLASHFDAILWRSVRDAPSCEELVADCITFCSESPPAEFPTSLERRIDQLVGRMQDRRCLLVLDNLETLLQEGDPEGNYRPGYEGYGRLIQRLAESAHQSCIVLTSREKPREIEALEGPRTPVRSLRLSGLSEVAARSLLEDKDLHGESAVWLQLIATYAGNPLALKIVAQTIVDLFSSDISEFLQSGELVFNGIRAVLRQQVERLTPLERVLLTWLAITREWTSLDALLRLVIPHMVRRRALEALEALRRRSLIERATAGASFTLQSVVMEHITDALVEQLGRDIPEGNLELLTGYALEYAQVKDYVRQTQVRLLVRPLLERLRAEFGPNRLVEESLLQLLDQFRAGDAATQGFGPANLLSLLRELRGHLRGLDLSRLSIRGAYLQGVEMQDTSLKGAILRETVFTEAMQPVSCVAVMDNGTFWAAGSSTGEVRVFRGDGFVPYLVLEAHGGRVNAIGFSPDGRTLASGGWDGVLKLWDVESGALLWTLRGHSANVTSLAFVPAGGQIASSSDDGTVRLWEANSGTCLQTLLSHGGNVEIVAWSPDGRLLATAGEDQLIRLWDVETWTCVRTLSGHSRWVLGLCFAPGRPSSSPGQGGGSRLASASRDQTVKLWDVESGRLLMSLPGHTDFVRSVAWSPAGHSLASCSNDGTIRLWDTGSGTQRACLLDHTNVVCSIAWTSDGIRLLSGSEDRTLRLWEAERAACVRLVQGYSLSLLAVAFNPQGTQLACGNSEGMISLWNVTDGATLPSLRGHRAPVRAVAWNPGGTWLASGSYDQTVRIWDPDMQACLRLLQGHNNLVMGVSWSPDGTSVASGSWDQTVRVWNVRDGTCRWVGHDSEPIRTVAFSPDGKLLATGNNGGAVLLWQVEQGTVLHSLHGHRWAVYTVAFSPDGRRLASCGEDGELLLWDAHSGERLRAFAGQHVAMTALAWSPRGDLLISGSNNGTMRWWDVESGACLKTFQGHEAWIYSVSINSAGSMIASSGTDGQLCLCDLHSGELLRTLHHDRPYERLDITGARGLTSAQITSLRALGAIYDGPVPTT